MTSLKKVYQLELFQAIEIGEFIVTRVPGGFLYTTIDSKKGLLGAPTFVPYNTCQADFFGLDKHKEKIPVRNVEFEIDTPECLWQLDPLDTISWNHLFWTLHTDINTECMILFFFNSENKEIYFMRTIGTDEDVIIKVKDQNINLSFPGATHVIAVHNHPNGRLEFSKNDLGSTAVMSLYCAIHGITIIDHILTTKFNEYISMMNTGQMKEIQDETTEKLSSWKFITD